MGIIMALQPAVAASSYQQTNTNKRTCLEKTTFYLLATIYPLIKKQA
jgi:hypothetical protein